MDAFTPLVVLEAEHRTLENGGVLHQYILDFSRIDIDPTGNNHVLFPIDDVEIALIITRGDIAYADPTILH